MTMTITMTKNVIKFFTTLAVMVMVMVIVSSSGNAQALPELMLTWKAANYAPPDYAGKVLPTAGTRVDLALEVIDANRLADISRSNISWSVNGEFQQSGVGLKTFSFNANGAKGDQLVTASLTYKSRSLDKQIVVPTADPEVAVVGGPDIFQALMYFFNLSSATQAKFTWTVNGDAVEGSGSNPDVLTLVGDLPAGTPVAIRVDVQNLLKPLEIATRSVNFVEQ